MKTIIKKIRYALLLGFLTMSVAAWSQGVPYINKMSITTQMFLDEMEGKIKFEEESPATKFSSPDLPPLPKPRRPIVTPDTIDGKVYIAATVRITSESDYDVLEKEGVIIQCKFDKGLVTTLIPIDRIKEVAALEGITRVEVSALLTPLTFRARQATNVDDVLTLSADALGAGLTSIYDGTGVILGVIDTGIDFQHGAFKDKNGNSRIKGAYCYNGSSVTADWTGSGTLPTTDDSSEDHGTHTSTIAGGSSVIVSGTNVTVTDNHANATYGGMAPGADMYLAATQLATNYVLNSFQKMVNYADQQGKPLVVSNSWSSDLYPTDGNCDVSDVLAQYFGDSHPNRICLFAAGNSAGMAIGGVGGGRYVTGTSSEASPLGTILRTTPYVENYGYQYYTGILAKAWTRATDANGIGLNIYVINKSTGAINNTYNYTSTNSNASQSITLGGINMTVYLYFDYVSSQGKHMTLLYAPTYKATANYLIAIEVYPIGGSNTTVDIYGGQYTYLTGNLSTSGHSWQYGTDDLSVSDNSTNPNVISVGSYVTYNGANSVGDISDFSGYSVEGVGPLGVKLPWITAPGEVLISGYNHYVSSHDGTVTVNNSTSPYGEMSGTSMATPAAAGIVAQWFQAAQEVGKDLTLSEVKNIMAQTAIQDQWTNGTNASHFGNGKINALGGIEYILNTYGSDDPVINASPMTVDFSGEPYNTYTETVVVGGRNLTGDITATLNDPNGVYSLNTTNLGTGGSLVITYLPRSQGNHNATITLTSPGAESKTVTITGTATIVAEATVADGTTTNTYLPIYGNQYGNKQINQMIYPESMLSEINGKKIKSMTFYAQQLNFSGGAFTVKMGTTTQTTYARTSYSRITADMTIVKTGQVAVSGGTELVITFDQPFEYDGGNLVMDFEVTATGTGGGTTRFYGVNPGSYTSFYSYGGNINTYGRYSTGGTRLQFLPKVKFEWEVDVEPITAGTVSPDALTFTDVRVGSSQEQTVIVTNTGNQPFTPVIDTANLPAEFTVTGGGELLPNGTLDLTVTYTPTDEGPHSGSFTVTIGDVTYTVTVTGNGYIPNNTLYSNEVTVPVYKTDLDVYGPYTYGQVIADTDHQLEGDITNGLVKVQAKNIDAITDYRLFHNAGAQNNTVNMSNWASGNNQSSVAYAVHSIANDNFTTYAMNGNAWAQDAVYTFQSGEEEMWIDLHDNVEVGDNVDTWYVPVTVANSKLGNENTYGSRMEQNPKLNSSVIVTVGYDDSSEHREYLDPVTGMYYVYVTAQANIIAEIPTIEINGHSYEAVLARAWRYYKPYIVGQGQSSDYVLELIGENTEINGATGIVNCSIGSDSWTETDSNNGYLFNEYTFCVKDRDQSNVTIFARLYYKRNDVVNPASGLRLSGSDGGYFAMDGEGDMPDEPTSVNEYFNNKELVDITFVNPQGMTSSRPFDGVNIVIKRYSDGSTSTSKVLNR